MARLRTAHPAARVSVLKAVTVLAAILALFSGCGSSPGPPPANRAPIVTNPGEQFAQIGDTVTLQIEASDPDGDDISYTAENLPPNLEIHPVIGEITGVIADFAILNNPFNVMITVTDDSQTLQSTEVHFLWVISKGETYLPLVIR